MKGDADKGPSPMSRAWSQQFDRHFRPAAEFARQRPFRALAIGQHVAEGPDRPARARELLHLALAVEGEEPHALLIGIGDVPFLLDRVAEGDPVGGHAAASKVDLDGRRSSKLEPSPRAPPHLARRVGLDRVKHLVIGIL